MSMLNNGWTGYGTTTPLPPKALSIKKAERWLAEHPEVNPVVFWTDQSEKGRRKAAKAMKVAFIFLGISLVFQIISLVLRIIAANG